MNNLLRILAVRLRMLCAVGLGLLAATAVTLAAASAQGNYPQRVITIVVPVAAGGPGDSAARLLVDRMSAELGQQVIVENVVGAGGMTGAARVSRSEPDGYTILVAQIGLTIGPALYPNLPFHVEKDLTAVGLVNTSYSFLVGRNSLSANNFQELAAWMKGPGRPAKFAHPGIGTLGHLQSVLLVSAMGTEANFIPYRGGGQAIQDVIGEHVDINIAGITSSIQLVKEKKVKPFLVTSKTRYAEAPDVPSMAEVGFPALSVPFWHAMWAPAATPKPIIDRLNAALRAAINHPDVKRAYAAAGTEAFPPEQMTPDAANAYVKSQVELWGKTVRDNNIKVDR
jgi:tripartite-type tricarboxylate transporter receptor subunit TctC